MHNSPERVLALMGKYASSLLLPSESHLFKSLAVICDTGIILEGDEADDYNLQDIYILHSWEEI